MSDVNEVIEKGLLDVKDTMSSKLDKQSEKLEKQISEMQSELDRQAKERGEVEESLKEKVEEAEKSLASLKERQDAFETKANRLSGGKQGGSFKHAFKDALKDNYEGVKAFYEGQTTSATFDVKAVMTEANDFTNDVVEPDRVPGIKYDPERRVRVRQFLPQGSTDSNQIYYVQETAYSDGTDVSAENSASGQSDLDLEQKADSVKKISAHFRISKEALSDLSQLSTHISTRGIEHYNNKEDQQLLYGTGTGNELEGLTVSATDYTLDQYTGDANAQEYDILLQAIKQLREAHYQPSAGMVSIDRYFQMIRRKDADGRYIFPQEVIFGSAVPRLMGIPIIATDALNDDDFLVADFPMLTTLFDREGVTVRFYEQDQDNVVKDLVTVQIMGRLALPTYLPNAGRYGDFANAITNAGNS